MSIVVDWESLPWSDETESGERIKVCERDGLRITLSERTQSSAADEWCTEPHLIHVLAGVCTVRFRDGEAIPVRAGDSAIVAQDEGEGHRVELGDGGFVRLLLFEQQTSATAEDELPASSAAIASAAAT